METLRILAMGDIVGQVGVDTFCRLARPYAAHEGVDALIVNGENAAPSNGIDPSSAEKLLRGGADVVTTGNHVFRRQEIGEYLDSTDRVIRPANYPAGTPGMGYTIIEVGGWRMLVINVMGVVFMEPLENPFRCVDRVISREEGNYDFAVLDIHAEATAEKIALARYFDGRISVIYGTHTHVQTADEQILPRGSGYITDLGMCGPDDSVLGVKTERIIEKFTRMMPVRFDTADGNVTLHGAIFELAPESGAVMSVTRVSLS